MRKPRDYDSELKALNDKAKLLKERKVRQLGELVTITGADTLDMETLAGALLTVAANRSTNEVEGWRRRGRDFFQGKASSPSRRTQSDVGGAAAGDSYAPPSGIKASAA
ncbi:MAG: conjugal transfer protein TraD [Sphingobium sp.]